MKNNLSKLLKPDWRKILVFIAFFLLFFISLPILLMMQNFSDKPASSFITNLVRYTP